jgi:Arc/MetJ-type ribon-helix-helix transcriptional regulator
VGEVVRAGLALLQRAEAQRAELLASVIAAEDEGERQGYLTGDEVAARVRAVIARRSAASV